MTSNPEPMGPQVQHEFHNLLTYVTSPDARSQTAYTVELTVFRRLLALGTALWRLFVVTRAAVRPAEPVTAPDGTHLPYHDQRPTTSSAVFGKVCFARPFFTRAFDFGRHCHLWTRRRCPAVVELKHGRGQMQSYIGPVREGICSPSGPDEICASSPHQLVGLHGCGSRKLIATRNRQMSAHAITLLAAHRDEATHPRLGLPGSAQAPAVGPVVVQDSPWLTPGACANNDRRVLPKSDIEQVLKE
jgi:hypothetical protein